MSNWEKALRQTQDTLESLYFSSGLGMPGCPSRRAGGGDWGEGEGWMDGEGEGSERLEKLCNATKNKVAVCNSRRYRSKKKENSVILVKREIEKSLGCICIQARKQTID